MAKKVNRSSNVVSFNESKDGFLLFGRAEFFKWLFQSEFSRQITRVQQHHTYRPNYAHWNDKPDQFHWCKSMKRSHLKRGFSDIGQHITTFPDGSICICRDFNKTGAGIKGKNARSIVIEHLGDFDIGQDDITSEHFKTALFVTAALCIRFDIEVNEDTILYHTWFASYKSCPGTNFFGGNTKEDAKNNFYPQIEAMIETLEDAR